MSERFADIEKRIATVHKLDTVISAMRGIAAARVQEAQGHLESIRTYAATVGAAIGEALAFFPVGDGDMAAAPETAAHAVIVLAAEQGFAGTFTERIFDTVEGMWTEACEMLLVGDRGLLTASERGMQVDWSAPMIAHPAQTASLASRLTDAIFDRIAAGLVGRVSIVHAEPGPEAELTFTVKPLVPFDYGRFPLSQKSVPPLVTLPPERLLARLVEEHVFAEVSEAIMLSFAAENAARMRAMVAAKDNVAETLADMVATSRRLRQEDITEEIIELATGSLVQA